MVSKSEIKLITGLAQKKYRRLHGLFVVEGIKSIKEFLNSRYRLHRIYALPESADSFDAPNIDSIDVKELRKISMLKSPQQALAVFEIPTKTGNSPAQHGLTLMLDDVRDPGNLGTIIRLCDWFGVGQLVCSEKTVDCYNPKVVQASMGSLSRVEVVYAVLTDYLAKNKLPVYGAFMNGKNFYTEPLSLDAILILGNEATGILPTTEEFIDHRISIPQHGSPTAESLNVATAGAILLSGFRRF